MSGQENRVAHALAGGLSVCGAEGSFAGMTANVPEAGMYLENGSRLKINGLIEIKLKKRI